MWKGFVSHYSYFLVNHKKSLELKTFEWWTETACNQLQVVTLNTYDKKASKWRQELNIQEKFLNFHNCAMTTYSAIFYINIPEVMKDSGIFELPPHFPLVFYQIEKSDMKVIKILAEKGNFTIIRPSLENRHISGNTDYLINQYPRHHRSNEEYCTPAFIDQDLTALYSLPESYSNYEKLVLPFDTDTWMCLIITFAVAFLSIFFMNFLPRFVKNIIYGKNIRMPSFNVLGTFFGIAQKKLPDNNFARIVLMSFILFCLVFRTAYQGVFFKMMTNEMRRSPPITFLDLKERNYTLLIPEINSFAAEILRTIPVEERPKTKSAPFFEMYETIGKLATNSTMKTAIVLSKIDYSFTKIAFKNIKVVQQSAQFEPYGVCTKRNNFATKITDKVMTHLFQGGITQHHLNYLLNFEFKKLLAEELGPYVLSVGDLGFGFIIWLIACAVCASVFVLEILWYFVTVKLPIIVEKVAFLVAIVILRKNILRVN